MRKENLLEFAQRIWTICPQIEISEVSEIVKIAKKLHKLNELECGVCKNGIDIILEYSESDNNYYMVYYDRFGNDFRKKVKDPFKSIKKKLNDLSNKYGIYFYLQTDPRGCPLYVSDKTINYSNYLYAIAVPV